MKYTTAKLVQHLCELVFVALGARYPNSLDITQHIGDRVPVLSFGPAGRFKSGVDQVKVGLQLIPLSHHGLKGSFNLCSVVHFVIVNASIFHVGEGGSTRLTRDWY
jgi:hypothetical protein